MKKFCYGLVWPLLLLACSGTAEPEVAAEVREPVLEQSDGGVDLELTEAQRATLEAADLHDGTSDKVVSECSRCALAMPGDEAHSTHVGEYELHFCGNSCKAAFEADPEKGIAEMQGSLDGQ
jgi:hypothetical protein